jgi:hypothetical protein
LQPAVVDLQRKRLGAGRWPFAEQPRATTTPRPSRTPAWLPNEGLEILSCVLARATS